MSELIDDVPPGSEEPATPLDAALAELPDLLDPRQREAALDGGVKAFYRGIALHQGALVVALCCALDKVQGIER
jgi:hypothetical protein